jgi:hypothetical protein
MSNPVNSPVHYTSLGALCECGRPIECIQIVKHMNFCVGSAVKYLWRVDLKGDPIENLEKSMKVIEHEIARRKALA